jgi:hypothetical protein
MIKLKAPVFVCFPLVSSVYADEWHGHVAKLSDAHIACRDIDSKDCLPNLAQAVAVVDVLDDLSSVVNNKVILPASSGRTLTCGTSFLQRLNCEALLHLALANYGPKDDVYCGILP